MCPATRTTRVSTTGCLTQASTASRSHLLPPPWRARCVRCWTLHDGAYRQLRPLAGGALARDRRPRRPRRPGPRPTGPAYPRTSPPAPAAPPCPPPPPPPPANPLPAPAPAHSPGPPPP